MSGTAGAVLSIPFSVSRAGVPFLSGAQASLFDIIGTAVVLLDSSVAGIYEVTLGFIAANGIAAVPKPLIFTVNAAAPLPALTLNVYAVDAHTIQCEISFNALYTSHQAALNQIYASSSIIDLLPDDRITVEDAGAEYDVQVRGKTAAGTFGPWSLVDSPDHAGGSGRDRSGRRGGYGRCVRRDARRQCSLQFPV